MTVSTRIADPADLEPALEGWRQANVARSKLPPPRRIARVRAKLADPSALVVVATEGSEVVGMALAEPGRDDDGSGPPVPELCHISMVFVHPQYWGRAIGQHLLTTLATCAAAQGFTRLQLWTGEHNERAQRLYRRAGFTPTGRTQSHDGQLVVQLTAALAGPSESRWEDGC